MQKFNSSIFLLIFVLIAVLAGSFLIFEIRDLEKDISQIFGAKISTTSLEEKSPSIKMFFVGDIMLDRGVEYMIKKHGDSDCRFPFLKIADDLEQADILFGNLESIISDKGTKVGSIYSFRADPETIKGLKYAGFDILSVANNHIFDYGREAMEDSFQRLQEADINYVGGGFLKNEACSLVLKKVKGINIAFLGYTNVGSRYWEATDTRSGICWLNEENLKLGIEKAKEGADLVIVSVHWGDEYQSEHSKEQEYFGYLAIDIGADLVIGHHAHVIQPIEQYKNGYIAYSLGNFVFDQGFSEETMNGLLFEVIIQNNKIKKVMPIRIKMNDFFQPEIIR